MIKSHVGLVCLILGSIYPLGCQSPSPDTRSAQDQSPVVSKSTNTALNQAQCSQKKGLNIVNGDVTTDFTATVLVVRINEDGKSWQGSTCTGTFIADNALVTAAHCVGEDPKSMYFVPGDILKRKDLASVARKGIAAEKIILSDLDYDEKLDPKSKSKSKVSKDLAILIFKSQVAPNRISILPRQVEKGDRVTLVGFGRTSIVSNEADKEDFVKRVGSNSIHAVGSHDGIVLFGKGESKGDGSGAEKSLAAHGDSGGPLLIDGAIAGVASMAGKSTKDSSLAFTLYVELATDASQRLLKKAMQAGAHLEMPDFCLAKN